MKKYYYMAIIFLAFITIGLFWINYNTSAKIECENPVIINKINQNGDSIVKSQEIIKLNENNEKQELEATKCLTDSEKSDFIEIAKKEISRHHVSIERRLCVIVVTDDEVIITFEPPKGVRIRAGDFIVKIARKTKKILDVKIWR